jgi:hypothetical protein
MALFGNREIGGRLFLGGGTVRNYVSNVLSKLYVPNRAEPAAFAVHHKVKDYAPLSSARHSSLVAGVSYQLRVSLLMYIVLLFNCCIPDEGGFLKVPLLF